MEALRGLCSFALVLSISPSPRQPWWPGSGKGAYGRRRTQKQPPALSARRKHHDDLTALKSRFLLDFRNLAGVILHAVKQLIAELLMCHLTPAETKRDLDLIALFEESLHGAHLHEIIVVIDHRPELDLLDLDNFLFLACLSRLLLRLIFIFAVIENFADGRG